MGELTTGVSWLGVSLAVLAAGWVVVLSPGDYAILKFPPLSRHSRRQIQHCQLIWRRR